MTILSRPTSSYSYLSWKVLVGSVEDRLCVQQRTDEGVEKNKQFLHRLLYRSTDLVQYRIIYSSDPLDYAADTARQSVARKEVNAPPRMVLAVADDAQAIMREWEIITQLWRKYVLSDMSNGLTVNSWKKLYAHIADSTTPAGTPTVDMELTADGDRELLKGGNYCSLSPFSRVPEEEEAPNREPLKQQEPLLDVYDVYLIRIMHLWCWTYPLGTLLYLFFLVIASRCGVMQFPLFCIITLLVGFTYPLRLMDSGELAGGGRIRCRLEMLLGWRSPRHVVASLIALVMVEHVVALLFPEWNLVEVLGRALLPMLAASLMYNGVFHVVEAVNPQMPFDSVENHTFKTQVILEEETLLDGEKGGKEFVVDGNLERAPPALDARKKALRDELTPEGPFSSIITRCIAFASVSNGWEVREKRPNGAVVLERQSMYSKNAAVLFIANVPHANVGTLQHLLLDDPEFTDAKTSYAYQYDKLLVQRANVAMLGINELLVLTRYKAAQWGVSSREVLNWVSCANLFTPSQQDSLGLRRDDGNELLAFAQCGVACADDVVVALPPAPTSEVYERAAAHIYLIMGLEEADGSLTLHVCYDVDPKGRIPNRFHAYINKQQVEKAEAIMTLLGKIGPKQNIVRPYVNARDFDPIIRHSPSCGNATSNKETDAWENAGMLTLKTTPPDTEVERIARRFVQELFLREWKLHSEKKGITLWTTRTPWSDRKAMRTISFIPGATLGDVEAVVNDLSLAPKLDRSIESQVVLKKVSEAVMVLRTTFHAPMWGVAAREVVTRATTAYYFGLAECVALGLPPMNGVCEGSVLLCVGEDAAKEFQTTPKYCRGRVFLFGVLAEEVEDEQGVRGVRLVRCAAADPGGSIPNIVVDAALVLQLENAANMVEFIKQQAAARKNSL
ncbi:hypothetical protein TraAM80_01441 [Trypanosoma rangeli]|uniref:START domain-containing protein n=1 Tax=Trypanosoma rangeli TaxID=5698 RepID=A0A422NYW3_TRYRA|nr:uncharacterized protein TraAM80_01441 [Trypanosoma rangeli]RNF10625.1 hypothetical protein TraAM80_01441 [Trypanosoma rangeli]|eukprot:RNF10625.1 hypothetical protein TraAM80_01441 [Trypanosoma rangeli]